MRARHMARSGRRPRWVAVLLTAGLVALAIGASVPATLLRPGGGDPAPRAAGVAGTRPTNPPAPASTPPAAGRGGDSVLAVERPARPAGARVVVVPRPSPPMEIEIPVIDTRARLERLGLEADGSMEAPGDFQRAGWFDLGPQPGQPGPAVIAGHVDSRDGPAIFFRLPELRAGDDVLVHRADGNTARFTVTRVERYPKEGFPADAVYGPVPGPELRLITCGGEFDRSRSQYRDNIVVYAVAS